MKSILLYSILPTLSLMCSADQGGASGAPAGAKKVGGPAPGTAPTSGTSPAPEATAKPGAPQPQVHEKLLVAIQGYDEHIQEAETFYIQMIETVLTEKISRADVVATLMKARKVTYETAQSQYSRMKNIWSNPDILAQLKAGEITLKVAREATTKKQADPAGANATAPAGGKTSNETKEARFERAKKAHVASVKECGFDLKSSMLSFEADLKAAGIK